MNINIGLNSVVAKAATVPTPLTSLKCLTHLGMQHCSSVTCIALSWHYKSDNGLAGCFVNTLTRTVHKHTMNMFVHRL